MFVKPQKGGQYMTLPEATFCLLKGEMLKKAATGCAGKPLVISGA